MIDGAGVGTTLSRLRAKANMTQAAVSNKAGMDQSRISRVETGEATPSTAELESYLSALGTQEALSYLRHVQEDWSFLELPTPENPDSDAIREAEEQLQRLEDFEQEKNPPGPVRAEIEMHRQSLLRLGRFLGELNYDIAFVGPIGVGKTTALCLAADLTVADPATGLDSKVILETGGGRVTLCEVQVRTGPAWGILIHPYPDDEVYRLVSELGDGLFAKSLTDDSDEAQKGLARELDRALRNMAGLQRYHQKTPDERSITVDLAAELAKTTGNKEEFRSEFASKLQLWKRTTRELWYDPNSQMPPRRWLRDTFGKINKGLLSGVSLPERLDIFVPEALLRQSIFTLGIVDTRGVDETAIRADLRARLEDPKTVTCLCSPFNSAPDSATKTLIERSLETGLQSAVTERLALLVLPRPGEALAKKDDVGELVGTDEEGYDLKLDEVQYALRHLGAEGLPVLFFNAASDDPAGLSEKLLGLVQRMRGQHVKRVHSVTAAVDRLVEDYELQSAEITRRSVIQELSNFIRKNEELPAALNPAYRFLLDEMRRTHPRTVWATTRRQGAWYNLDIYAHLGDGAAREATRRSQEFFNGLEARVAIMLDNEELEAAHLFLGEVLVNVKHKREAFIEDVHNAGLETFRPGLQDDVSLWSRCEDRWGRGSGYRDVVIEELSVWFNDSNRERLHRALEIRVGDAWRRQVVRPLRALCADSAD